MRLNEEQARRRGAPGFLMHHLESEASGAHATLSEQTGHVLSALAAAFLPPSTSSRKAVSSFPA